MQQRIDVALREVEPKTSDEETMDQRIDRVREDLKCLNTFYNIDISPTRVARLKSYYKEQLDELSNSVKPCFDSLDQESKTDYLLLQNYLRRNLRTLELDEARDKKMEPMLSLFAPLIIRLCEDRQSMKPMDAEKAAQTLNAIDKALLQVKEHVDDGNYDGKIEKFTAFRAAKAVDTLRNRLAEWFGFYKGYDPMFTWWATATYEKVNKELEELSPAIREKLIGLKPDEDKDAIVGQPIGRDGLLTDLQGEMIPYSPEELVKVGESEYKWCEAEMKAASHELGFGDDWHRALEHVKTLYVPPGTQTQLVHDLAVEGINCVTENDLVTVPRLASETWRMTMLSPEQQKISPFFLGGQKIQVSFPTDTMDHEAKMMSMRGNNIHFSRSTVFHELIPGHHLQMYMANRYRPYRRMFTTPFWIEGNALYWEMILWDKKFPKTPENRIGMLFWRMHRCARIVFSLKFHLGQMSPQECIDMLVSKVGHERSTAEAEVRRSFGGDYTPLYQAGYMLGALQQYALRRELVDTGKMTEKQYHDRILHENQMPIELLRALLKNLPLTPDYKASWRFYDGEWK